MQRVSSVASPLRSYAVPAEPGDRQERPADYDVHAYSRVFECEIRWELWRAYEVLDLIIVKRTKHVVSYLLELIVEALVYLIYEPEPDGAQCLLAI